MRTSGSAFDDGNAYWRAYAKLNLARTLLREAAADAGPILQASFVERLHQISGEVDAMIDRLLVSQKVDASIFQGKPAAETGHE